MKGTWYDLLEPPKVSHKKKTDREREKERMEKELIELARDEYNNRQLSLRRPMLPREPLKRTDGNNWVHIICAAWTPEIRFSQATTLEKAEGFSAIPLERHEAVCKVCTENRHGACASCQQCKANFHIGCAAEVGYTFGFDVTPVKGSRKDQVTTVTLAGETGALTAAIWCKEHSIKTMVHPISEVADDTGKNALQLFVESYKQADQTLTGTARKANLLGQSIKLSSQQNVAPVATNRRVSMASSAARGTRHSSAGVGRADEPERTNTPNDLQNEERSCATCGIDVSPKWWPTEEKSAPKPVSPAVDEDQDIHMSGTVEGTPQVNGEGIKEENVNGDGPPAAAAHSLRSRYECHKCHWKSLQEPTSEAEQKQASSSPTRPTPVSRDWDPTPSDVPTPAPGQTPYLAPAVNSTSEPPSDARNTGPGALMQPPLHGPYQHSNGFAAPPQPAQVPQSSGINGINGVNGVNGVNGHGMAYNHPPPGPYTMAPDQNSARPPPPQFAQANGHTPAPPHHQHQMQMGSLPAPSQQLSNGMRSPQYPLATPSYMGAGVPPQAQQYAPGRTSESPFGAGQQAPATNGQHGSPPLNFARPVTPRDSSVDPRMGSNGASASPNLRNLLH